MYAQSEQEPTVTVFLVEGDSDAFIIVIGDLEILLFGGITIEVGYDFFTIFAEVLFIDLYSDLFAFDRFFQASDKAVKSFAFIAELNGFDNYFCNEVCTVIKEVVFSHGGMT